MFQALVVVDNFYHLRKRIPPLVKRKKHAILAVGAAVLGRKHVVFVFVFVAVVVVHVDVVHVDFAGDSSWQKGRMLVRIGRHFDYGVCVYGVFELFPLGFLGDGAIEYW